MVVRLIQHVRFKARASTCTLKLPGCKFSGGAFCGNDSGRVGFLCLVSRLESDTILYCLKAAGLVTPSDFTLTHDIGPTYLLGPRGPRQIADHATFLALSVPPTRFADNAYSWNDEDRSLYNASVRIPRIS